MSSPSVISLILIVCTSFAPAWLQDGKDKKQTSAERRTAAKAKKDAARKKKTAARTDVSVRKAALTEDQQASAMAFALENHPELVPLIESLKKSRQQDYNRALRDLHLAETRFGRLKSRLSAERYEQQLEVWKLDSRIRLQLAKWSVSKDDKLEADIRKSLAKRQQIQRQQYEQELQKLTERQSRLESLLNKLNTGSVDAEWDRVSKTLRRRKAGKSNKQQSKKSSDG